MLPLDHLARSLSITGHNDCVVEVKFSPTDPHILATWDYNGEVRLWDALAGNCIHRFQCGTGGTTRYSFEENFINFSPDGKLLACMGSEVKVFRVATGQLAAVCKVEGERVCWNTRGNKLAIAAKKNSNTREDKRRDIVVFEL